VGNEPLPELYRRFIFDPLGMTRTGFEGYDLRAEEIADSYGRPPAQAGSLPSPFSGRRAVRTDNLVNLSAGLMFFNSWARGAGSVSSTACDLGRFMRAVVQGRLTVLQDQQQTFAAAAARPTASFSWNGGSAGIQASILYAPASDAIVVVLTNGTNVGDGSHDIATRLLEVVRAQSDGVETSAPSACAAAGDSGARVAAVQDAIRAYERSFRTGDIGAMRRAFAENGAYLILRPDYAEPLRVRAFADAFAGWAGEPDPNSWVEIDEISFLGQRTALVRLRLHYRGRTYLDQLSLHRFGGDWRIVAKQSESVD
jgi:hypothetical protein